MDYKTSLSLVWSESETKPKHVMRREYPWAGEMELMKKHDYLVGFCYVTRTQN